MKIESRASSFDVAIVGGGFSGTMVAIQLLRSAPAGTSIAIVESRRQLGHGRAYDTDCQDHILNVPAGNMSALPEDPNHFLRWCEAELDFPVTARDFVARGLYGRYINSFFHSTAASCPQADCKHYHGEAVSLELNGEGVKLTMADGAEICAQQVVLAIGGMPPGNLSGMAGAGDSYVANPWNIDISMQPNGTDPVLILGSGLTAVDTVMSLRRNNYSGRVAMLSRHGRLPQVHGEPGHGHKSDALRESLPGKTRLLVRKLREEIKDAEKNGTDWRSVLDSLRPMYDEIWGTMPPEEQRRFLRHARSYWEIHRHRMAPQVGKLLREMVADGRVSLIAGTLISVRQSDGATEVSFRERGATAERRLRVSKIINCTGHGTDVRNTNDGLLRSLLESGIGNPDPLFLGLAVSTDGALINREGEPSEAIYVIGSMRKGVLWETTAVRELREQAAALASRIGRVLTSSASRPATRALL